MVETHSKKEKSFLYRWLFRDSQDDKFEKALVGFIISLMLLVNSRKILLPFFALIMWIIIFIPTFIIRNVNNTDYSMLTLIYSILVMAIYLFLTYLTIFSKQKNFETKNGFKIFLKSLLFKAPFLLAIMLFAISLAIILIDLFKFFQQGIPIPYDLFYYLIILVLMPSMAFFAFLFYILFMMAIPGIRPKGYIQYSINVLKSKDSFLLKKSKLYCLLKMAYISYENEMTKHFGKEIKEIFNNDNILKLSSFASTIDINDEITQEKFLEILNDLDQNIWHDQSNKFKEILKKIGDFTSDFEINIDSLKKRLLRQKLKKYTYLVISLIAIIINSIFFILNHFQ